MNAPTIEEITAAAKASAQSTPRPSRAFWIEAITSYLRQPALQRDVFMVARSRGWAHPTDSYGYLPTVIEERLGTLGEADLRALFVELLAVGAEDKAAARARWGAVFGLCEAP